ncbi:MAG: 7TM diverse intracellular signaling domain-containing protein [Spirochaetota bacterium]
MSHRGYAFQFLWPGQPWWANVSLPLLMNLLGMFGAFFVRAIMETRTAAPRTDRIFFTLRVRTVFQWRPASQSCCRRACACR